MKFLGEDDCEIGLRFLGGPCRALIRRDAILHFPVMRGLRRTKKY